MRTKSIVKGTATGPSQWVPVDDSAMSFGIGFLVDVQGGSSLTYKVQMGFCDRENDRQDTDNQSRAATVNTITWGNPHGLQVGDSIVCQGAGAPFDGTFDVATVASPTVITTTVANSGPTAPAGGARIWKIHVTDHPIVTGQTTSQAGNVAFPCSMIRANLTVWVSGQITMTINQGFEG